ncbi:MAG: hypothetical protein GX249_01550 [Firmicutes bacterium]|nr:hypothetical protein [Bacillota bacterium]
MIGWAITGILSYLAVPLFRPMLSGQKRRNYRGEEIPTALGLAFVLPGALMMTARLHLKFSGLFALALLLFALFGLIDDVYGELSPKGFRGHFSTPRFSTGVCKALGGFAAGLALASSLNTSLWQVILNGGNIALLANFMNLLDLRPGRCGKTFILLGFIVFLLRPSDLGPLFAMLWAVAGYLSWDLRRSVMMGDTGSNALGAVLGLACTISFSLGARIALLLVLVGLNLVAERVSFSDIIESNRFLHYLDQLGR